MADEPRVSVLLPVRDGGSFLQAAISSVLQQDFTSFEVVAIEDGSTDGSRSVLEQVARTDRRVRIIQGGGTGLVDALNLGLEACRAPLVARMDADDVAWPRRFTVQITEMERRPELSVLGGGLRTIDADGNVLSHIGYPVGDAAVRARLPDGPPVAHPAVVFRRREILELGGYHRWFVHCEDYDLWLRSYSAGAIDNLREIVLDHRQHRGSVSHRHAVEQQERCEIAWWCHRLRASGEPEPVFQTTDDAVAASERFPPEWRRRVMTSLLLRRTPLVGGSDDDAGQARLLRGLSRMGMDPAHIAAYHLRRSGWAGRAGRRLEAVEDLAHALAISPDTSLRAIFSRSSGGSATTLPDRLRAEDQPFP